MNPWDQSWWAWARLKELAWTSLGTVQLAFWLVLGAILYLALFTNRNPQVIAAISTLMPLAIGLGLTYSARRVADKGIEARFAGTANGEEFAVFHPGQDDPTRL